MTTRFISMAAGVGLLSLSLIPLNSNAAANVTPREVTDIAELQHVVGPNKVMAGPLKSMNLFVDNYTANHFIRTKSPSSYTPVDLTAAPYDMFVTKSENESSLGAYGMMLASVGLMAIIARRKLSFEEE